MKSLFAALILLSPTFQDEDIAVLVDRLRSDNVESRGHRVSRALREAAPEPSDAADTMPAKAQGGQT